MLDLYHGAGITESEYVENGREIIVRFATRNGFRQWWKERGYYGCAPRFRAWVQSLVDANEA